jgi:hypothetical protein
MWHELLPPLEEKEEKHALPRGEVLVELKHSTPLKPNEEFVVNCTYAH